MRLRTVILSLALIIFTFSVALSQSTVYEGFDYPVGEPLEGLGDASGGWAGPWVLFEASDDNAEVFIVEDTNFDYNDELPWLVENSGNHIIATHPYDWAMQRYGRQLSPIWPNEEGNVYWFSFVVDLVDFPSASWGLVGFFDVVGDTAWAERPGVGHGWGRSLVGLGTFGEETDPGYSSFTFADGPFYLVTKIVMSGDTTAQMYLFVNPNPDGPEPDEATADAVAEHNMPDGIQAIAVHFGGDGEGKQMKVDEITLASSWGAVVSVGDEYELPNQFHLAQNYPNPFNPSTTITYSLAETDHVTLSVYNLLGQQVAMLVDEVQSQGTHRKTFDASHLPSGVYLYRIQAGSNTDMKKMLMIK